VPFHDRPPGRIRCHYIDCTGDSETLSGFFDDGSQRDDPKWIGTPTAAYDFILFLTGDCPYLYERAKHPRLERMSGEDERPDWAEYIDRDSTLRRITPQAAVRWFEGQHRDVPDAVRRLTVAATDRIAKSGRPRLTRKQLSAYNGWAKQWKRRPRGEKKHAFCSRLGIKVHELNAALQALRRHRIAQ
jgi:hypothetical protein